MGWGNSRTTPSIGDARSSGTQSVRMRRHRASSSATSEDARPVPFTRLDDREAIGMLLQHFRVGVTITVALRMSRISRAAFYRWLKVADECADTSRTEQTKFQQKCIDFVEEAELAHGHAIGSLELVMARAAREDWRAAEKFLKRLHPERWGGYAPSTGIAKLACGCESCPPGPGAELDADSPVLPGASHVGRTYDGTRGSAGEHNRSRERTGSQRGRGVRDPCDRDTNRA